MLPTTNSIALSDQFSLAAFRSLGIVDAFPDKPAPTSCARAWLASDRPIQTVAQ